jgi:hypothetical protein
VLSSLVRLSGFLWGYWLREERPVTKEFVAFLRREQKDALRKFLHFGSGRETRAAENSNGAAAAPPDRISPGKPTVRPNA